MPAVSTKQRQLFAIAEHAPGKLHKENKGLAKLPKKTLHEFAATKGLGAKKPQAKGSLSQMHGAAQKKAFAARKGGK